MDKRRPAQIVISIIMSSFLMAGCGNSSGVAKTSIDTSEKVVSAPTSVETSEGSIKQDENAEQVSLPEESKPKTEELSIEETVILDQDGIRVTAKNIDNSSLFGPAIVMMMENDSGKDLTFQARDVSVNGYMIQSLFSCDVVNGKKANDSFTIMKTELEKAQISTIADIEFSLHIFESNSWEDVLNSEPIKLETSAAAGYSYSYDDSGDLVYEGNGVKIVVKGLSEDNSIFGPGIILYLENTGDQGLTIQARDVSINGFMINPMFSCDLPANKHAVDAITFMKSDLESNNIDKITDVELSFHIFDKQSWDTVVDTDTVMIHF
ncbi:MAG: hypothetical protein K6B72_12250 [Lachnospiraceae bacterium]|nr:hypothetical protein [Lachnospiraceae bacterium]